MGRRTKSVLIAATAAVLVGLIVIAMILMRPRNNDVFDDHVEKINETQAQAQDANISGTGVMESAEAVSAPEKATAEDTQEAENLYNNIISQPLTVTISSNNGITDTISTDTLQSWVSLSGTDVTVDASKVASYVQGIADKYNSWGQQISFTTTGGKTISLGAVDYGWKLNQDVTAADIQSAVLSGNGGTVPVTWSSKETVMGTNGVGNTYIEADLDSQHVYVYKAGSLVLQSDVVSGRAVKNWCTPNGVFEIVGMQRDATLKGENYETPVSYWMPFYLGWGFHDANWRSAFGGTLYVANGSHGCINLPPSFAKQLFDTIYVGMPVIVYGGMSQDQAQTYLASASTEKTDEDTSADASSSASSGTSQEDSKTEEQKDTADVANTSASDASALADAKAIAAAVGLSTDDQQAQIIAQAVANYEAVGMTKDQAKAQVQADLQQQASAQQAAASDSSAAGQSAAASGAAPGAEQTPADNSAASQAAGAAAAPQPQSGDAAAPAQ